MITTLALSALLTLGTSAPEVDTVIRVTRGSRLEMDMGSQATAIEIRAWDRDELSVVSPAQVSVSTTNGRVRLTSAGRQQRSGRQPASYTVSVPRWMPIAVDASRGRVTVEGVAADVAIEATMGTVRVRGVNGRVEASSVQGSVVVEDTEGSVDVSSVNDGVRLTGVTGPVRVESVNGSISLVRVDTDDLIAESTNGNIDFEGPIRNDGRYRLTTHNGRVSIAVPEDANATIGVSTYNGRYTTGFPVSVTQMGRDRRFTFVVGNGSARIEASSFNGNIEFRRPGPRPAVSDGATSSQEGL